MGNYLNPGSKGFRESLNSAIYVDKTLLIEKTNAVLDTRQKFLCVSRPRRFGKSMAADMLAAYYDQEEDSSRLFEKLAISRKESYKKNLNQYDVIKINMQEFLSVTNNIDEMLRTLQSRIIADLKRRYPEYVEGNHLMFVMQDIFSFTKKSFVILIDEWDCLFREYQQDKDAQKKYLDFLRGWLKDKDYVALAYMTGILPIKKYGSHSALNMFTEYSMTDPGDLAEYFGFTEEEVKTLCSEYQMSFDEAKAWYDGYQLVTHGKNGAICRSMYSPKSVSEAMLRHRFGTYWNQTETYEAYVTNLRSKLITCLPAICEANFECGQFPLESYIDMDMDGLKDAVIRMLAGDEIPVNTGTFSNDMTTFAAKDDVLTLLVYLGYLTYNSLSKTVAIPNKEVSQEYVNAIRTMDWHEVTNSVEASKKLLEALWAMNSKAVAEGIDRAHREVSILQYNDENALSCTINLAFYFAREYYTIIRELPGGKGFADICFIPRKRYLDKPAAVIELKWNKTVYGAIAQIKDRHYVESLKDYLGNLLLVGINYDKKTKKHSCFIEKMQKEE